MPVGCRTVPQQPADVTETVRLYFGSAGNEEFVTEEREITYREGEDRYTVTLKELIQGPDNQGYRANIPENTEAYGTIRQNSSLIVNVSSHFLNFADTVTELVAVGTIVNTLTQFEEIANVKLLVEGEEYTGPSGVARGFMEPFTEYGETEVILYFSNEQATAVAPETRTINVPPGATLADTLAVVLAELIDGPQEPQLSRTIPPEVTVLSVMIAEQTAVIDFSEEMHTQHWGGAAGESMTINSVVNTLTEFDGIDLVQMTVAGEPMNIEHAILEDPLPRNEDMIER